MNWSGTSLWYFIRLGRVSDATQSRLLFSFYVELCRGVGFETFFLPLSQFESGRMTESLPTAALLDHQ